MSLTDQAAAFVKDNPILAGMGGATAAGFILAHAKEAPLRLWHLITEQFTTELTIWSEDTIFEDFDRWLSQHPSTSRMRRLAITEWHEERQRRDDFALTPGPGSHVIWSGKRPFFVHRHVEDASASDRANRRRRQSIRVVTPGRSQGPIRQLMNDVRRVREGRDMMCIHTWDGFIAMLMDRRPKRPMDTIYCNPALKQSLIDDIQKFLASKDEYNSRGIPFRRSYMFEGEPGTGKTSMIFALASLIERPVMIVQAATIANDRELISAMNAGSDHIVVIEEVDSLRAAETRDTATPTDTDDTSKAGITLAGLLEAMDGLTAREGRILFLTTNKPDVLDEALKRPGRIDVRKHFDLATMDDAIAMFTRFFPGRDSTEFRAEITPKLPMAHAELQSLLLAGYS